MQIQLWSIIAHVINALILYLAFRLWLYKPVKKVLDERRRKIVDERNEIEAMNEEARNMKMHYDQVLARAHEDAARITTEANERSKQKAAEVIEDAKRKGQELIAQAQRMADLQLEEARQNARRESAQLVIDLTEKMLARHVTLGDHENLVKQFMDGVDGK